MSSNKIGSGGRLYPVEDGVELPPAVKKSRLNWPSMRVPTAAAKNRAENVEKRRDWRQILSTFGELAGISSISAGAGWYSPGAGLIVFGLGVLVVSVAASIPPVLGHELQGKPETR
jgi:hypothetical protein